MRHLVLITALLLTLHEVTAEEPPPTVRRYRQQAIQLVTTSGGWLGTRDSGLSQRHYEVTLRTGVPLGSFSRILGLTPSFRTDFLQPPAVSALDVPREVHEAGLSVFYRSELNERWSAMGIVRPSFRGDFTTSDNAVRVFGLGLLTWKAIPDELSLSFGAVFLDRADLPLLPAVGLRWQPTTDVQLDLQFPKSKLQWRVARPESDSELWVYATAEIGGNTWAVKRANGSTDEMSLRDIRMRAGIEYVMDGGSGWFVETGWAFRRRLEYEQSQTEVSFSDAMLIRAGLRY